MIVPTKNLCLTTYVWWPIRVVISSIVDVTAYLRRQKITSPPTVVRLHQRPRAIAILKTFWPACPSFNEPTKHSSVTAWATCSLTALGRERNVRQSTHVLTYLSLNSNVGGDIFKVIFFTYVDGLQSYLWSIGSGIYNYMYIHFSQFFHFYNYLYGNCYTFNSGVKGSVLRTNRGGPLFGEKLHVAMFMLSTLMDHKHLPEVLA